MADVDLEELEAQLAALRKAKRSGALIVRHGDTSITYRSMADINEAIGELVDAINQANGTPGRGPKYIRQDSKGL